MPACRTRFPTPASRRAPLRAALLAALAFGAASASAWVSIGESEATAYYLDPGSVRTEGAQRRVWRLFDLKERQPDGVKSGKALVEIDCRAGTYRYLKTMYYSQGMGKGRYLGGRGEHRKEHIGPGTLIAQLANMVCQPAGDRPAAPAVVPASKK